MKRLWLIFTVLLLTVSACGTKSDSKSTTNQLGDYKNQSVFVTKTGKKYHRDNCRYLKSSKREIELSAALDKGYTPCKVCKPS
jgi:competence protein ComEC|tara:strand:+ start:43 stop:291 length:249 start_codon:yes stop_codon:yes gene_type:complete